MKLSSLPTLFSSPFGADAASGNITQPIPATTSASGRASLQQGFPSTAFQSINAGGTFPYGQDFNGILYMLSAAAQAQQAGVLQPFDADFANDIGGYPKNAVVADPNLAGLFWISENDGNTTPPGHTGSTWLASYGNNSFNQTGYTIALSGEMRQWGTYNTGNDGFAGINFPLKFPNAVLGALCCENNAQTTWLQNLPTFHGYYNLIQTGMVVLSRGVDKNSSTGWAPQQCTGQWVAWGY